MYLFYAWVWNNGISFGGAWQVCVVLFFVIVLLAWGALRFYDTPVRSYLTARFVNKKR